MHHFQLPRQKVSDISFASEVWGILVHYKTSPARTYTMDIFDYINIYYWDGECETKAASKFSDVICFLWILLKIIIPQRVYRLFSVWRSFTCHLKVPSKITLISSISILLTQAYFDFIYSCFSMDACIDFTSWFKRLSINMSNIFDNEIRRGDEFVKDFAKSLEDNLILHELTWPIDSIGFILITR